MEERNDYRAIGANIMIEGEYLIFGRYADPSDDILEGDLDEAITETMALTRRGKTFVEGGIFGYARLRDLPRVRALQSEHKLLDVPRLSAINRTLMVLPPSLPAESWELIDDTLTAMFTLTRPGQELPSIHRITSRLRQLIASIDSSVNFSPRKRKRRETSTAPSAYFFPAEENGVARDGLALVADKVTMANIDASLKSTARENKISLADAIIQLLTGSLTPSAPMVLNVFTPNGPAGPAYLPGFGWTGAEERDHLERLFEQNPPDIVNLDDIRASRVDGYCPTPKMAMYVRTRDGTCVYPGCHRVADNCQLDHRIPYDEGGPTTPDNLFCLCQHHHNIKTDKRAFYVPDPATGDVIWLFANGTWLTASNNGILRDQITPESPRWATTVENNHRSIAATARFNAMCHALCDAYEHDGDYEKCIAGIRKLEQEFELTFECTPAPEDLSWIPPEPDLEEPPFPDPYDDVEPAQFCLRIA
ncbi:HNH endonuclease signature motif containing protein [Corynebacterium sp.]|uniref:HNH endonuclease signature motif containing protein n=1 Tax=Corynebacterium sp. TaxID=1720 RepID=UPI002A917691|nr:HNH endonuclease signature motif containing protein [Corynebacterium sp.]MDY5785138.1 HNH endonuclease signature motif containing protein [Corynebacterium sp.]